MSSLPLSSLSSCGRQGVCAAQPRTELNFGAIARGTVRAGPWLLPMLASGREARVPGRLQALVCLKLGKFRVLLDRSGAQTTQRVKAQPRPRLNNRDSPPSPAENRRGRPRRALFLSVAFFAQTAFCG